MSGTDPLSKHPTGIKLFMQNLHTLVHDKLTDTNYPAWALNVTTALSAHLLLGWVTGDDKAPPEKLQKDGGQIDNPDFALWTLIDTQIQACLLAILSPSVHKYAQLESILSDLDAVNEIIPERDIINAVVRGLPADYSSFKQLVRMNEASLTLAQISGWLGAEELNLEFEQKLTMAESSIGGTHTALYTAGGDRGQQDERRSGSRGCTQQSGRGGGSVQQYSQPHHGRGGGRSSRGGPYRGGGGRGSQGCELPVCKICDKQGNSAASCWYRYDESTAESSSSGGSRAMHAATSTQNGNWYLDTGANTHVTPDFSRLHAPVSPIPTPGTAPPHQHLPAANPKATSPILPTIQHHSPRPTPYHPATHPSSTAQPTPPIPPGFPLSHRPPTNPPPPPPNTHPMQTRAKSVPYSFFTKDATLANATAGHYDYIVIGGGTAGCALAATLSTSVKVLLLQRGGLPYINPNATHQSGFAYTYFDMSPASAAQQFVSADGVRLVRGRILGGGSAINVGYYSRASKEEVSEAGWDPHLVNESYMWVERKLTFRVKTLLEWQAAVKDRLVEAGVVPYNRGTYEHLEGTKIGNSICDENGYRHSAADLLDYADDTKITLYLHVVVHQILFKIPSPGRKPIAYGVFFKDSKGNGHTAFLNGGPNSEIILSAGAIGSPQLLMLSGIGPSDHLKSHGIDVILDQQMVGQRMADNLLSRILVPSIKPVETSFSDVVGITHSGNYIETLSGLALVPEAIQVLMQAGINMSFPDMKMQGGALFSKVNKTFSEGHLELKNRDPNDNPTVTFNYFKDSRDLQTCVRGMEVIKKVFESHAFASLRNPSSSFQSILNLAATIPINQRPKHHRKSISFEQFCVENVFSMCHYHGGCRVDSVVDRDYKVIGVDALRVVDASTFFSAPGTNPQATIMMLGSTKLLKTMFFLQGTQAFSDGIPKLGDGNLEK
ncbi:unnamed protein product [Cuscuta campestris]|uniref:Glucose-methanol-choline oxidoreductase N-terminal domain-containing protein n=1 Tax=Cuscuta campestris TaxID=132261 RepID=A0A484N646_9ASTE|nr:unnamed protein product [Cuscuta campestris]